MKIRPCSCDESQHLRAALKAIAKVATTETGMTFVDDLAQIANLADQGLGLKRLEGDPALTLKSKLDRAME